MEAPPYPEPKTLWEIMAIFPDAHAKICDYVETGMIPEGSPAHWDWNHIRDSFYTTNRHITYLLSRLIKQTANEPNADARKAGAEAITEALRHLRV